MSQCSVLSSSHLLLGYLILLVLVMVLEVQYTLDAKLPLDILPRGHRNRRRILKSGELEARIGPPPDGEAGVTVGPGAAPQNDSELGGEFMDFSPRVSYYDAAGSTEAPSEGNSRQGDLGGASSPVSQGPPPLREVTPVPSIRPPKAIKVSPEVNAFNELVDLLTASKTHCLALDPETKRRRGKALYRCSVHKQSDCRQRVPSGKQNKAYPKKCRSGSRDRRKYKPGYEIDPLAHKWPGDTPFASSANAIEGSWSEGEAEGATKYTLTVDADYTFMEEIKKLKYWPLVTFDTKFDLAGLNSLHKYEIVWKLLQVLRWLLPRNGYLLVRSSADGDDLLQYLQEEGLQEPLHILTLWKLQG
ncbi:uncharacterized protein LOC122243143 [Penaeus japonicus]|uniref:uncharacterized protein LOC122243143 n=1 Tax=Penaeus japonicus TaxID=27405 RepID=UPI001C710E65|nr:uncharacterized protein LOC122243143 [Penaeus japonicus]